MMKLSHLHNHTHIRKRAFAVGIALCLACISSLQSQSLSLFGIDASAFPAMKANFYAFDANGTRQTPSASELSLTENGIVRTITNVTCPTLTKPVDLSSVLVVDVSGSMAYGQTGNARIDLAKAAATVWVNGLPLGASECAVSSFDQANYLNQDFTTDRSKLLSAINGLQAQGGTDYDEALQNPEAGGLVVSARGKNQKVIVLLTDGVPSQVPDVAAIVREANKQGCRIYSVSLGMPAPQSLKDIAAQTGAMYFEMVENTQQVLDAYRKILQNAQGFPACQVRWNSSAPCGSLAMTVELQWQALKAPQTYELPPGALATLQLSPPYVYFGGRIPGTQNDTTVTLTAVNDDFNLTGVTKTFGSGSFSVVGVTFPITIPRNTSQTVTLRFSPTDSSMQYASFSFQTDKCPSYLSASGGFIGKRMQSKTLRVTSPNGGERFVVGSDSVITWTGIAPTDAVRVEYSIDGMTNWIVLSDSATGLNYTWKRIPRPTSTACFVRVVQLSQGSSANDNSIPLLGHSEPVLKATFSPDGTKVVTASVDNTAKIWDAISGRLLFTLSGHTNYIRTAVFSPDGLKVLTASDDHTARLWDVGSGTLLHTFAGHSNALWSAAYSPDGKKMVTASYDGTAKIWDAASGALLRTLSGHTGVVYSAAFSPDGSKVATASWDFSAKIWDANSGGLLHTLLGHTHEVNSVVFSPDGTKLVTSSWDNTAKVWSVADGSLLNTLSGHTYVVYNASFNSDGTKIVTASADNTAKIWNAADGSLLHTLTGHSFAVLDASFSHDDAYVVTAGADHDARIWDAGSGSLISALHAHASEVNSAVFNRDGSRVVTASGDKTARLWLPLNVLQSDVSDAAFSIVAPISSARDVDMLQCVVGGRRDSVVSTFFNNTGSYPCRVDSISIQGADAVQFHLVSGIPPYVVDPSSMHAVEFEFAPSSIGVKSAQLLIYTQSDTLHQSITGVGIPPSLSVLHNVIDFGQVAVGTHKDTLQALTVMNIEPSSLRIDSIVFLGPNATDFSSLSGTSAITLKSGDSARLDLRFSARTAGRTSGRLAFHFNGTGSPVILQLFAEGVQHGPQIASNDLTIAPIVCTTTVVDTLRIHNSGSDTLRVDSLVIGGADAGNFSLVSAFSPQLVPVDSSIALAIRFASAVPGARVASLSVYSNSMTDSVFTIALKARKESADFVTTGDSVILGTLCPAEPMDTTLQLVNNGSVSNSFMLRSGAMVLDQSHVAVGPTGTKGIQLHFPGRTMEGPFDEIIEIQDSLCAVQKTVHCIGTIQLPQLSIVSTEDFARVAIGSSITRELVAVNRDVRPIVLKTPPALPAPFSVVSMVPPAGTVINVGDTVHVFVSYAAASVQSDTITLTWSIVSPCSSLDSTVLIAQGVVPDTARTTVRVEDISGQSGAMVSLNLLLSESSGMSLAGAPTKWSAKLHYNNTILFNTQSSNVCASGTADSCELELSGSYDASTTRLISIPCVLTLGNTDHAELAIDEFHWLDNSIATEVQTQNGMVQLTDVCEQGGVRLVIAAGHSTSLATRPNPVRSTIQISYGLREALNVTLELINTNGQVVQTFVNAQQLNAGEYTATEDLSSLSAGVYLLRMRTNKEVLTTRLELVH